jgi:phosphatidylinositol alpha-mannosyltransferase
VSYNSKSMKIGLVCPYNMFKGGGVQECILAMQAELIKRGYDPYIITPKPRDFTGSAPEKMILVGTATDVKSPFHTTAQVSVSVEPDELETMLKKHKFDLLHFHEPWVPIVSRQILIRSEAANVATFHAKLPGTVMSRTIEKVITPYTNSVLKYLHELVAVSDAAAEYVKTLKAPDPLIIPNGIDLKKYVTRPRKPSKQKTILYIGRLERRKGIKYLLKAFAKIAQTDANVRLIIAGEGTDRQKLEMYVRENDIPHVEFKGFISEEEKLNLLQTADVFCSPALFGESFGIVLLEAMASGCVVVAGDNAGYRAVLQEKGKLSLVDPKDTTEFVRRLELMLHDEDLRQMWQTWAQGYITQFSYENIVDQYEKVYKKALKAKKA